jgi:hypothetical protein
MVTLLVHLWVPEKTETPGGSAWPPPLRGVVSSGPPHSPRPFSGAEQLVRQLKEALADRLREEEDRSSPIGTRDEGNTT